MGAGAVVAFVSNYYVQSILGYFQVGRRFGVIGDYIHHGLPIALGLLTFIILRSNKKVLSFCADSVYELVRVVFPGATEVRMGTIVVIITILISGTLLSILDLGLKEFIGTIIGV